MNGAASEAPDGSPLSARAGLLKRVLYLGTVDVGLPDGPGVNEREFVMAAARRFGDGFAAVLPRPSGEDGELPATACHYCRPHGGRGRLHLAWFVLEQACFSVFTALRRRPDIVVVRLGPFPLAAWLLARGLRVPVAVKTLGRLDPVLRVSGRGPGRWLRTIDAWLHRSILRHAVAVDAVTPELLQRAAEQVRDHGRLRLIDNAVNVGRFIPGVANGRPPVDGLQKWQPVVGYAGGMPSQRGAVQLVQCLDRLRDRLPKLAILVVGDDPGLDAVRQLAVARGLEARCFFVGSVEYPEVPRYLDCMDICVSFDVPEMAIVRGNASQKVRQYLAMGKPVISTDAGNAFLVEQDLGSLAHPDDHEAIATQVATWWSRLETGAPGFSQRARAFARTNLSTDVALERRISFWLDRLPAGR